MIKYATSEKIPDLRGIRSGKDSSIWEHHEDHVLTDKFSKHTWSTAAVASQLAVDFHPGRIGLTFADRCPKPAPFVFITTSISKAFEFWSLRWWQLCQRTCNQLVQTKIDCNQLVQTNISWKHFAPKNPAALYGSSSCYRFRFNEYLNRIFSFLFRNPAFPLKVKKHM